MTSTTKNILISIIFALFAFSAVSAADTLKYSLIPAKDYSKIPQLSLAREFGLKFTLNNGIKQGKLSNVTYNLVSNNAIYNATNGTNVYYKFNMTYKNAKGDIVKPVFVVQYNTLTKTQIVKSSSFNVKYAGNSSNPTNGNGNGNTPNITNPGSSNPSNSFTKVPVSKYNDSIIHSSLMYGVNYVANYAISKGSLPQATYKILSINSIYQQKLATAINYKYDVTIQDLNNTRTAQAFFIVKYQLVSRVKSMASYSYKVLPYKK